MVWFFKVLSLNGILAPKVIVKVSPVLHFTECIVRVTDEDLKHIDIECSQLIKTDILVHDVVEFNIAKPTLRLHVVDCC